MTDAAKGLRAIARSGRYPVSMDDEDMDDVLREEQDRALDEQLANQSHG